MNFIFAVVTLALKYYMVAQLPGDASLAYFGFGHEFHQLERENSIDILCPFAPETFCSPAPIVPVPSVTKTVQYIVDSASVTLKLPLSLPAPAPSWSPSVQPPVDPEFGASHTLAPTSTYKYVPVEDVLEELSCISMIFIVALILSTIGVAIGCFMSGTSRSVAPQTETITKGAAEESHGSVLTLSVLSFILVAVCFGRASVPSSLFERILDVLCFFLLLSVSTLVLLKFPRVSSDIAHQQQRTSHISSESIFADMLSTSSTIESSIEETNTKDECEDSSIPRAGSVNPCVVAPFESVTSNEAGNSSRTVMSTPANGTVNNSIIDSKSIIDADICSTDEDTGSALAFLKFPHVSSDTAHQQRTSHIASEPTFADMLSTSIAIESDIEEANTKAECKDPPIPRAGFVNSCVVAPFESATSNKSGSSSRTVMSTPANGTVNNSIIDSNVSKFLEHKLALFKANSASVLPCTTLATELDPAHVPLPDDGNKLTAAVPTPFDQDDTHGTAIPKAYESATMVDCVPANTSASNGFVDPLTAPLPEAIETELEINALDVLLAEDQFDWETSNIGLEVIGTSTPCKCSRLQMLH
ncbi:hypothetical protein A7U60_g2763 [Sanghuangporus baumii]|uniref:Uncharacterized protein n=1 Tax=Sanghuangporus baumii TaxID=108892 RepID=A0A9Q5NAC8_SANBA|nr:hypothetical protein A7U60_g2763 [Sanghuangporus baumii]